VKVHNCTEYVCLRRQQITVSEGREGEQKVHLAAYIRVDVLVNGE
jgi:hypothetical protein